MVRRSYKVKGRLESCIQTRNGETGRSSKCSIVLAAAREIKCEVCSRKFRRENNRKRHKYLKDRSLPVNKQKGAAQCQSCNRWFRSRGGLAVHTCRPPGSLRTHGD